METKSGLAVLLTAYLFPSVRVEHYGYAIFTLGLFLLVINAIMILLVSSLVPTFQVDGYWWALV